VLAGAIRLLKLCRFTRVMRYSRQELVVGKASQRKLRKATVCIVGMGAIGCVAADLLARSGVNLSVIDRDFIEVSNLQRQTLYEESDIGSSKALASAVRLQAINSEIKVKGNAADLDYRNVVRCGFN